MVFRSTPASLSQKLSVPRISSRGSPELKPSRNILTG
jgi:hypothetical protein